MARLTALNIWCSRCYAAPEQPCINAKSTGHLRRPHNVRIASAQGYNMVTHTTPQAR